MRIIDATYLFLLTARWLHFSAIFLAFGASLFPFYARQGAAAVMADLPWAAGKTLLLLRLATAVAALSGLGWLVAAMATMNGGLAGLLDPDFVETFFFATPFGPIELGRLVFLLALPTAAWLPGAARRRFGLVAAIAAVLLVSQAWLGHAAEGGDRPYGWTMIATYAVHMLAGAAWIGGLPVLLLTLIEQGHRPERAAGDRVAFWLLQRFSAMAVAAVSAVVVSGAANTAFRVGRSASALTATSYGRVLLLKLVFVALTLVLAALTRFGLMPRLRHTPASATTRGGVTNRPALAVGLELGCGLLVLAVAAVLGITPPPQ